jgi:predicted RNase H-like HicB family nuclease
MKDQQLPDPKREHRYSLMINWSDTDDSYIVSIPELRAKTHGATLQEAVEMAKDLIECHVQDPPVVDPVPERLLFDDRTNFAPNPFERLPELRQDLERFGKWSDEQDQQRASETSSVTEAAAA